MATVAVVNDDEGAREVIARLVERDGHTVAQVSKKWFRVRDTYGVEVAQGEDEPLMLALTVAIDEMARG